MAEGNEAGRRAVRQRHKRCGPSDPDRSAAPPWVGRLRLWILTSVILHLLGLLGVHLGLQGLADREALVARVRFSAPASPAKTWLAPGPAIPGPEGRYNGLEPRPATSGPAVSPESVVGEGWAPAPWPTEGTGGAGGTGWGWSWVPEPSSLSKPLEYILSPEPMPDLNDLALALTTEATAEREQYARLWMPDADTTDAESRKRRQAEAIVQRAIEAMGGREALLAIHSLQTRVWVKNRYNLIHPRPVRVDTVRPYLYPVEERFCGEQGCREKPVAVDDLAARIAPFPRFGYYNPILYPYRQIAAGWPALGRYLPPEVIASRQLGESRRWHFLDQFLGDGIILTLAPHRSPEDAGDDGILVDDRRYGAYLEAWFDRHTGLLKRTIETVTDSERQEMHRRWPGSLPPIWIRDYSEHRQVGPVLMAHRLVCAYRDPAGRRTPFQVIYLQMAANGAPLPAEVPALLDQDR